MSITQCVIEQDNQDHIGLSDVTPLHTLTTDYEWINTVAEGHQSGSKREEVSIGRSAHACLMPVCVCVSVCVCVCEREKHRERNRERKTGRKEKREAEIFEPPA